MFAICSCYINRHQQYVPPSYHTSVPARQYLRIPAPHNVTERIQALQAIIHSTHTNTARIERQKKKERIFPPLITVAFWICRIHKNTIAIQPERGQAYNGQHRFLRTSRGLPIFGVWHLYVANRPQRTTYIYTQKRTQTHTYTHTHRYAVHFRGSTVHFPVAARFMLACYKNLFWNHPLAEPV